MPHNQDYFALFGILPQPFVDTGALRKTYLALQQQFHPDTFSDKSEQDKLLAVQMTAQINEAYRTLNDDILRAEYLLNQTLDAPIDANQTVQDNRLLMMQMELHEELENITADTQREAFISKIKSIKEAKLHAFADAYQSDPEAASAILQQMKFFNRLNQQAQSKGASWH